MAMSKGNSFGRVETVNNDVSMYGGLDIRGTLKKSGTAITATAAELNYLGASSPGVAVASKTLVLGANKNVDTLVIADGGLYLGATAGTSVTATAAELNFNDTAVAGTAVASKTLVLGATKNVDTLTSLEFKVGYGAPTLFPGLVNEGELNFSGVTPGTETHGSLVTTGSTWVAHTAVGACAFKLLCSSTAASGDYATMRIRGRADAVSTGGVEGINASASANIADYTNLCAGYFAAQPMAINTTAADGIISAIHAVIDRTGTSSGRTWVAWIDTHQETKSGAGDYLMRLSHNGTVANDGVITLYNGGRMPQFINFEDVAGCLSTSDSGTFTKTHKVAVKIAGDATQYYIEMGTIA